MSVAVCLAKYKCCYHMLDLLTTRVMNIFGIAGTFPCYTCFVFFLFGDFEFWHTESVNLRDQHFSMTSKESTNFKVQDRFSKVETVL